MATLFGNNNVHVIDVDNALRELKENASPDDPVGTIIWLNQDEDGEITGVTKEYPEEKVDVRGIGMPDNSSILIAFTAMITLAIALIVPATFFILKVYPKMIALH